MHRFFIFNKQDRPTEEITPTKELFHQLTKVLRIRDNEQFICIYENLELQCKLEDNKIIVTQFNEFSIKKNNKVTLIQAVPTNTKVSTILQKTTELDVDEIILWQSKRSTSKINDFNSKKERFEKIIIEACEQTRRNDIPKLSFLGSIEEYDFNNKKVIVLYENEKDIYFTNEISKDDKELVIIVGPEGGFEEEEIKLLESKGASICSIGKNILRTETASIAAIAIANSILRN